MGLRYNFIVPRSGHDLESLRTDDVESLADLYAHGEYCWGLLTYRMLKDGGLDVALSEDLDSKAVNLAHVNVLRTVKPRWDCFLVSLQADFPRCPLAQFHVVQNKDQLDDSSAFVPLWPQFGQVPRSGTREGVSVVAYQGRAGFSDLDADRLGKDLGAAGIEFRALGEQEWADLSGVDVLLGIRSFSKKEYRRKPPSKLTNAWLAGIPFVGGWDSAFSQQGVPGEDYLRVSSYDEMLEAILRLKNDPVFCRELIGRGREKAKGFTFDAVSREWKRLLQHEVGPAYEMWQALPDKRLRFGMKRACCRTGAGIRSLARSLYAVPGIKRMRDRYLDPVK